MSAIRLNQMPQEIKPQIETSWSAVPEKQWLDQPKEKLFDIWSFLAGFMMAGGVWLWWWVIRVLIIN